MNEQMAIWILLGLLVLSRLELLLTNRRQKDERREWWASLQAERNSHDDDTLCFASERNRMLAGASAERRDLYNRIAAGSLADYAAIEESKRVVAERQADEHAEEAPAPVGTGRGQAQGANVEDLEPDMLAARAGFERLMRLGE